MGIRELHLAVSREQVENLRQRRRLLLACRADGSLARWVKEFCAGNLLFFTSLFVWTYNPRDKKEGGRGVVRGGEQVVPFIAWECQDEALKTILWCIDHDEDLLIEKSRQMGASWMMVIVFVWLWLFRPQVALLMMSRDERSVESESPASLFWKIDFILSYLPAWLMPAKWRRKKLLFINEDSGGTIFGEASTGKAGVGATLTAMAIDEFSQIEADYEVLHRTSDATGCRIFNGTHKGLDRAFYELSQRVDMKKLLLHWSQHPERIAGAYRAQPERGQVEILDKQYEYPAGYYFHNSGEPMGGPYPGLRSPWYDRQCRRKLDKRAVAMDLDIDAKGSVTQFFDAVTIQGLREEYCCDPYWEGDISYDRDTGEPQGLVRMAGGPLRLWCYLDGAGKPVPGPYKFGCDPSTGNGATPSCLSIVHGQLGEKVGEYSHAHMKPEAFGIMAVALCRWFADEGGNGAEFIWELQGPGLFMGKRILEIGYRNIYYRAQELPKTTKLVVSDNPGWVNHPDTKRVLLEEYRAALHARLFINRSWPALAQCLDYKWNKKGGIEHALEEKTEDPTGARANHGDQVIADALANKLLKPTALRRRQAAQAEVMRVGTLAWRRALHEEQARRELEWA
jgi:hypothetical protein